jgi:hypothetical protein
MCFSTRLEWLIEMFSNKHPAQIDGRKWENKETQRSLLMWKRADVINVFFFFQYSKLIAFVVYIRKVVIYLIHELTKACSII